MTVYNRTPRAAAAWREEFGGATADRHPLRPGPSSCSCASVPTTTCASHDRSRRRAVGHARRVSARRPHDRVCRARGGAPRSRGQRRRGLRRRTGVGRGGAQQGTLTGSCAAAREDAVVRAAIVIDAYARACTRLGGPGAGQRCKMVNQIAIAGLLQALAEAIDFAQRAGLDIDTVVRTISQGAAGSWQMENRATTMAAGEFDFGFALDWMRKDLGLCLREADRLGASLPVTALVDQHYARLQRDGHGRWDSSALIALLSSPT
ncbi:MAG: NAD(P)-dependent oxidoreductase [Acidimicrobiales bacterium]